MDSGEFGREAQEKWSMYNECVRRSLGYAFYHQAPNAPHWVVSPKGERTFLRDELEIRQFYNGLSSHEKEMIIKEKGALAGIVGIEARVQFDL